MGFSGRLCCSEARPGASLGKGAPVSVTCHWAGQGLWQRPCVRRPRHRPPSDL